METLVFTQFIHFLFFLFFVVSVDAFGAAAELPVQTGDRQTSDSYKKNAERFYPIFQEMPEFHRKEAEWDQLKKVESDANSKGLKGTEREQYVADEMGIYNFKNNPEELFNSPLGALFDDLAGDKL